MSPRHRGRFVALAPVALVALLGLASCSSTAAPAATIDGTKITDAQLAHEVNLFSFLAGLSRQPCGTKVPGETDQSACARFSLSNVIQEHYVDVYAREHQISISDADVSKTLAGLDSQLGAPTVDKELKSNHLTRTDLSELARRVLLFSKVQSAVTAAQVSEAGLKQQYRQSILQFTTVQVDHILLKTQAEAEKVYRQVTASGATEKDFLALAKKVSIDPSAKQNSGSLGSAVASTYVPEFGSAAAALEPGAISKPVQTQFGWHVIRLVSKQVTPYSRARAQLIQQQSITVFNVWLRDRISAGTVEVNPKYGRFDVKTLSIQPIRSTTGSGVSPTPSPVNATPASSPSP